MLKREVKERERDFKKIIMHFTAELKVISFILEANFQNQLIPRMTDISHSLNSRSSDKRHSLTWLSRNRIVTYLPFC